MHMVEVQWRDKICTRRSHRDLYKEITQRFAQGDHTETCTRGSHRDLHKEITQRFVQGDHTEICTRGSHRDLYKGITYRLAQGDHTAQRRPTKMHSTATLPTVFDQVQWCDRDEDVLPARKKQYQYLPLLLFPPLGVAYQ